MRDAIFSYVMMSDNELAGRKVLHILCAFGFVQPHMTTNSVHAEGNESYGELTLCKGAVVKHSEHSASEYPEAYEKVEWAQEVLHYGIMSEREYPSV